MNAGIVVRAEGITWPLETFLDCHGFIRTNGDVPDFSGLVGQVDIVMQSGDLREGVEMSAVPWCEVLAVNVPHLSMKLAVCDVCEMSIVPLKIIHKGGGNISLVQDICGNCEKGCW